MQQHSRTLCNKQCKFWRTRTETKPKFTNTHKHAPIGCEFRECVFQHMFEVLCVLGLLRDPKISHVETCGIVFIHFVHICAAVNAKSETLFMGVSPCYVNFLRKTFTSNHKGSTSTKHSGPKVTGHKCTIYSNLQESANDRIQLHHLRQ